MKIDEPKVKALLLDMSSIVCEYKGDDLNQAVELLSAFLERAKSTKTDVEIINTMLMHTMFLKGEPLYNK